MIDLAVAEILVDINIYYIYSLHIVQYGILLGYCICTSDGDRLDLHYVLGGVCLGLQGDGIFQGDRLLYLSGFVIMVISIDPLEHRFILL